MKFSMTIGGILISMAGIALASWGFSETCSNEIIVKVGPFLGGIPGHIISWIGRVRVGDITVLGVKKG